MATRILSCSVFIDANIFLDFYRFSPDTLAQLRELSEHIERGEARLYVTRQLRDEIARSRDGVIAQSIKELRNQNLKLKLPTLSKGYPQYQSLTEHQRDYDKLHSELVRKIEADAAQNQLDADTSIKALLDAGTEVPETPQLIERAQIRMARGNPPGKQGSLGDAINWLSLLDGVGSSEDLYVASNDSDYTSPLSGQLHPFLAQEWNDRKRSTIYYCPHLGDLLTLVVPAIELAADLEKDRRISLLAGSTSFAETHKAVSELRAFDDFSPAQLNSIVDAATSNTQVRWILSDGDVRSFLMGALAGNEGQLDPDVRRRLYEAAQEAQVNLSLQEPPATTSPLQRFEPGERVHHPTFGVGTVLKSTLTRTDEEVMVQFDGAGLKILSGTLAPLSKEPF